jgi:two-component system, LytTR family, response regulator
MNFSEIQYLEAAENYTIFHKANGSKLLLAYTLKHFEKKYALEKSFSRIHRKFLVNRDCVIAYNDFEVTLTTGQKLPISRRKSF